MLQVLQAAWCSPPQALEYSQASDPKQFLENRSTLECLFKKIPKVGDALGRATQRLTYLGSKSPKLQATRYTQWAGGLIKPMEDTQAPGSDGIF